MDELTLIEHSPERDEISILPIPFEVGAEDIRVVEAPKYFMERGFTDALVEGGLNVSLLPFARSLKSARDTVAREVGQNKRVISIGGDHGVAISTVSGASKALKGDLGLIWIDVHGDAHTPKTSWSQNVHGMVFSSLLGLGSDELMTLVPKPVRTEHALHIGARHLEQAEIDFLRTNKIPHTTMMEFDAYGLLPAQKNIDTLLSRTPRVWVSLDVDAIDESIAPATALAQRGGFTFREISNLLTYISKHAHVVGMDIAEVVPQKDIDFKTVDLCIELAASVFGARTDEYAKKYRSYLRGNVESLGMKKVKVQAKKR